MHTDELLDFYRIINSKIIRKEAHSREQASLKEGYGNN